MHLQLVSSKTALPVIDSKSQTAAYYGSSLTNSPFNRFARGNCYRNQSDVGVATVEMEVYHEPLPSSRLTEPEENPSFLLGEILVKAGIISRSEIFNARAAGRSEQARASFAEIFAKFSQGNLSFDQAIVAADHVHLTGAPLSEALSLVTPVQPARVFCLTVVDFLRQTGLVKEADIEALKLEGQVEPKTLHSALLSAGVIDCKTLRNATRLRYCLNKGELTFEQAKEAMQHCVTEGVDAEDYMLRCPI